MGDFLGRLSPLPSLLQGLGEGPRSDSRRGRPLRQLPREPRMGPIRPSVHAASDRRRRSAPPTRGRPEISRTCSGAAGRGPPRARAPGVRVVRLRGPDSRKGIRPPCRRLREAASLRAAPQAGARDGGCGIAAPCAMRTFTTRRTAREAAAATVDTSRPRKERTAPRVKGGRRRNGRGRARTGRGATRARRSRRFGRRRRFLAGVRPR